MEFHWNNPRATGQQRQGIALETRPQIQRKQGSLP
jgi:hypothetical protein